MNKRKAAAVLAAGLLALQGCASTAEINEPAPRPTGVRMKAAVAWPEERLEKNEDGIPLLRVYVASEEKVETMDLETYVEGVLAGEMKNNWPEEALKAQAILARTFVLKFVDEKESKYPDADISTDIEEAQAYNRDAVNDSIRQAVADTRGMVLSAEGQLPYAWFHAHSGGTTERAVAGLGWKEAEPAYTAVVKGNEPETVENEKDLQLLKDARRWQAAFPAEEFEAACRSLGAEVSIDADTRLSVGERGEGGRAKTIVVDGKSLPAADLRIALGSTKMRSTLLTSLKVQDGQVVMEGSGYGHGVGMSQWGAYGMAQQGSSAREIVEHYFTGITTEKLW